MRTIITHPNFDYLGEQIVKSNSGKIVKAQVDFSTFDDGWPNIFIEKVKEVIEHKDVTYIGDFSKPSELFLNHSVISGILDYYANKLRIIMPFFPVGTMERADVKGQVATAKNLADIFSSLPSGRDGKNSIHIFDIHALQEKYYFDSKNINVELHTAMNLLEQEIIGKTIVFPDDGAKKRFGRDFPDNEKLSFAKIRDGDKRILTLQGGDVKDKDVLLIDDLIQTGGTLIETTKILREKGAKSVSAFSTHGVFPKKSYIALADTLDELIVTDSIPENIERAKEVENMKVLGLKYDIEKLIFKDN